MDTAVYYKSASIGKKIESIRNLRGLTQEELANGLGVSKQAVSKLEQSEKIEDERLSQIADVLGVTLDGLKGFREDNVFINTNNFYDTTTFTHSPVSANVSSQTINNPIEKIIELYESLLKSEREKVEILLKKIEG